MTRMWLSVKKKLNQADAANVLLRLISNSSTGRFTRTKLTLQKNLCLSLVFFTEKKYNYVLQKLMKNRFVIIWLKFNDFFLS